MMKRKFWIPLFALTLVVGALFFSVPAYAADDPIPEAVAENLTVDAVWMEGDMLNIEVTDKLTGVNQTLQLSLDEYAGNSEYVSVQAVDRNGNKSNTIQFKNPFYDPSAAETTPAPTDPANTAKPPAESESSVPDGWKPLTPDGTGTVVDNVTDGDGKEFFTITTPDGNEFYMIIDRQRSSENVYLLNAVTEDDLASLAKPGDGKSESGVPTQNPSEQNPPPTTTTPEPEPSAPPANNGGMSGGTIIFIIIAAVAVGGAGYYFKILRPKKQAADTDDGEDDYDDEDDGSEDDDRDYGDPGEDGDEE